MSLPNTVKKHPSEVLNIGIDFTNRLGVGETISSASASVVAPGTITLGAVTFASPVVTVPVSAGTDGKTDSFTVDAVTNAGETLAAVVQMAVSATDF